MHGVLQFSLYPRSSFSRAGSLISSGWCVRMIGHRNTQAGRMTWARCHSSRHPGRGFHNTSTMKHPWKSSVMLLKRHMVVVSTSPTVFSSKCKRAPIKLLTLPRFELLAIHTGAKLAPAVKGALSKSNYVLNITVLYSVSTIALSWIKAVPVWWHTCESNLVSQIKSMLPTTEFIHVPSEKSPADLCSRGLLATQ